MNNLDLSEIDPLKWAEVRRRVDVVTGYLNLAKPKAVDRQRSAAKLDLGIQRFGDLVRAWQDQQTAKSMLPGRDIVRPSKSKAGGIHPEAREIARNVIGQARAGTSLPVLVSVIDKRCSVAGISPPSKSAVWLLTKERFKKQIQVGNQSIIIGRAFLRLPMKEGDGVGMPEAVVVVESPSGRVIDVFINPTDLKDRRRRLAAAIEKVPAGTMVIASTAETDLISGIIPSEERQEVTPFQAKRLLSDALGKRIGRIKLNYQSMVLAPTQLMVSELDRPLSRQDTELAVEFAKQQHNITLIKGFNGQQAGQEAA